MQTPETPKISYPDTLTWSDPSGAPAMVPGHVLPVETIITYHLPHGDIEIRHKGDHLEMRCAWQRSMGWLAFSPAHGEMQVRVFPDTSPTKEP